MLNGASNGGATITGYTVTAAPGGGTCSWSSGPLRCTVSGLTNGTPYTFSVTATNVKSNGQVLINGDRSSETTNGSAKYTITTDANGVAHFSVSGSEPGPIDVGHSQAIARLVPPDDG